MQAVNNGCVADYGSFIVVMKFAVVVCAINGIAVIFQRRELIPTHRAFQIVGNRNRWGWRQGGFIRLCVGIESSILEFFYAEYQSRF